MNKRNAILIVTGALALGLSACLWESEQDDGGSIGGASGGGSTGFSSGGTGFTGGSGGTGFTGGSGGTGFTGGGVFFLRSTDGGAASDELEGSSDGTPSAGD
jgi:hypothetical protein